MFVFPDAGATSLALLGLGGGTTDGTLVVRGGAFAVVLAGFLAGVFSKNGKD